MAVGIWSAVGALALAVGPLLGGLISQHLELGLDLLHQRARSASPRWPSACGRSASRRERPGAPPPRPARRGAVGAALFALTYALIEGHDQGWTSPLILGAFALAAALGLAFVVARAAQRRSRWSHVSLFRERVFTGGLIALVMWGFGLFGIYFFTSLYLQNVLGFSPTEAGAAFVPMALLMAVGAIASERVANRIGAYRSVGLAMAADGGRASPRSACSGADATFWQLMPSFALIGIGGGLSVPLTATVPRRDAAGRGGRRIRHLQRRRVRWPGCSASR